MNRSVLSAVLIVLGLSAWMVSGKDEQVQVTKAEVHETSTPLMKVQVIHSLAKPVQQLASIQGQVEAVRSVKIKAEIEGSVEALLIDKGDRVKANTLLIKLADDYRPAQLAEAKARLKQRLSELKASKRLLKRGLQAENQMVADQAEVEAARADVAQAKFQLGHTSIHAPFAGVINSKFIEMGGFVEKGTVIAELLDDQQLVVTGQVPQNKISGLVQGQSVGVNLANGDVRKGILTFISAAADPATRSYRVEVSIDNPTFERLIGLSATLMLPMGEYQGHWVPSSVLGLSASGQLQVKILDAQNRVLAKPVEIIRTDEDGFWLSGLEKSVKLVSLGQNFVSTGDQVEPTEQVAGGGQ